MLEFWFNPQVSIVKKLLFLAIIIVVTAVLYSIEPLTLDAMLMFMGTGIIFLICRYGKVHFLAQKTTTLLYRLLTWIPIALLLALIFFNMKNNELLLPGAQGLGFMAIAIYLFSPMSLFNQSPTLKK